MFGVLPPGFKMAVKGPKRNIIIRRSVVALRIHDDAIASVRIAKV